MSYAGIGTYNSRSLLQKKCIKDYGITKNQLNIWLYYYAIRPLAISKKKWDYLAPRFYSVHKRFIFKYKSLPFAAHEIANTILNRGEQCVAMWDRCNSFGHYFNIAKTETSNIPWYVCAQSYINPETISLYDQLKQIEYNFYGPNYLCEVSFILTPYQACELVDDEGIPMVYYG